MMKYLDGEELEVENEDGYTRFKLEKRKEYSFKTNVRDGSGFNIKNIHLFFVVKTKKNYVHASLRIARKGQTPPPPLLPCGAWVWKT